MKQRSPLVTAVLAALPSLLVATAAWPAALADALSSCRAERNDEARLACYDAIAPVPGIAAAAADEPDRGEADFGLEYSAINAPEQLTSSVVGLQEQPHGGLVIRLANDQVWQQTANERLLLKVGDTVFLHRGAMTAFYLSTSENGRRYRVARIR